jgi:radical SAM protein with 4Fe4S-binding SPASM domain
MDTIEMCHSYNIPLTIVMLGSKVNLYEENVRAIFDIALRFDAVVRVNIYRPVEGLCVFSEKYVLPIDQLLSFLRFVGTAYKVLSISDPLLSALLTTKTIADASGVSSLRILPNGDVTPSTYLIADEFIIGNITNGFTLKDISQNPHLIQTMTNILPDSCKGCRHSDSCGGGVIDRRYLWYGSLEKKDPYCFADDNELYEKYRSTIMVSTDEFQSVHDGYLPTLFFKN